MIRGSSLIMATMSGSTATATITKPVLELGTGIAITRAAAPSPRSSLMCRFDT